MSKRLLSLLVSSGLVVAVAAPARADTSTTIAPTTTTAPTTTAPTTTAPTTTAPTTTAPTTAAPTTTAPTTAAPTTTTAPTTTIPAPADFSSHLITLYNQADTVPAPAAGAVPPAQETPAQFAQQVNQLSPDQLATIYDQSPSAWDQAFANVDQYASTVLPMAGASPTSTSTTISPSTSSVPPAASTPTTAGPGSSSPSSSSPPSTAAAPSTTGAPTFGAMHAAAATFSAASPPPPTIFEPTPCPLADLPDQGGGYQILYSLTVTQETVEAVTQDIEAAASGTDALIDENIPAAQQTEEAVAFALDIAATAVGAVAAVLEIPIDVMEFLLNRTVDSCQPDNAGAENDVVGANTVATETNLNDIFGIDTQNLQEDQAINALLDGRTQTIITQLDVAQTSLDQALRHSIEEALTGGIPTAIVAYELPSSLGGYLDAQPIGVQAIVTSTMALMQTAHQPIPSTAPQNLVLANNALAGGHYKQAFSYYQTTYKLLTH